MISFIYTSVTLLSVDEGGESGIKFKAKNIAFCIKPMTRFKSPGRDGFSM